MNYRVSREEGSLNPLPHTVPTKFADEHILDAKTHERFEGRIKQIVRDLSARAGGSTMKGVVLTKKTRAKSNGEARGAEQT